MQKTGTIEIYSLLFIKYQINLWIKLDIVALIQTTAILEVLCIINKNNSVNVSYSLSHT